MSVSIVLFFPPEQIRNRFFKQKQAPDLVHVGNPVNQRLTSWLIGVFVAIQVLLPLRHHLYEGNVFWTEEGHRLSWRMMLRSKTGNASFIVKTKDGSFVNHNINDHLTHKQYYNMSTHPDMIWQYVQYLESLYGNDISVNVVAYVQLNRGPSVPMIDREVDLAKEDWHRFKHHEWITEFPGWPQ